MQSAQQAQFIDLNTQQDKIKSQVEKALQKVLRHGQYVLGPEVVELENKLASFTQSPYAVSCNSGTDALRLLLMLHHVGPKDAVFVPSFSFAATAEVVALAGAVPIFIDVLDNTYNMDPQSLEQGIQQAHKHQLTPRGIIAVDLFGLPADYPSLSEVAQAHQLWIIADAAQSFGGSLAKQKVGTLADMTATSFFPSKPLGAYGDGGMMFIKNPEDAAQLRSLRTHGEGSDKYDNIQVGLNSRLDTFQAAVLLEKLKLFEGELRRRKWAAALYQALLHPAFDCPSIESSFESAWALFSLRCQPGTRAKTMKALSEAQIPHRVYYPIPLHRQKAYHQFPLASSKLATTDRLAEQIISIPMHPYLTELQIDYIVNTLNQSIK